MAETKLTNIIVPSIFSTYFLEESIKRNRLYKSGIITRDASIDALLAGGGLTFNAPFFKDLSGDSDVPAETGTQTVNAISTGQEVIRRQLRTKAWGTNAFANIESGADVLSAIQNYVANYWATEYDKNAIYTIIGLVNDNLTNDSGDLTLDISDESGTSAYISDSALLRTMAKHGENGVIGRGDNTEFQYILMHSNVYHYLVNQDAITFTPISGQVRPLGLYKGMEVIVDDNVVRQSESGGYAYYTFVFKPGALKMGTSSVGYEPTSMERVEGRGMGVDELYTRTVFALHSPGFAWVGASVAGSSPTDSELAKGANWNRVASSAQNCKFACLIHEVPDAWEI